MTPSSAFSITLFSATLQLASMAGCRSHETSPRSPSRSTATVLRGVRLIDGAGGQPVENATLVIEGDSLGAVGATGRVRVPEGAKVIDLKGVTVVPGLVSNHSHVGIVDGVRAGSGNATRANVLRQLGQFEAYGVTTVTSLGLNGAIFDELQPDLHRGALPGADLFGADRGIGVPSAAPPVKVEASQIYRPNTPDEARQAVRETAARHPAFVKIWVDDFHGSLSSKMTPDVYEAVIDEAHRRGLRVAAHVFYLDDAKRLVAAGVDVLAHGVRDRAVDADFITEVKKHKTWYIPTLGVDESFYIYAERPAWMGNPFFRHALQPEVVSQFDDSAWRATILDNSAKMAVDKRALAVNLQNLKTLHDAGVSIGFGADSGANPLRIPGFAEHRELELMTQAGLTPLESIDVATHGAASLLGLEDRGVLAPGKLADFVVVSGNPASDIHDIHRIVAVWHRGKQVRQGVETFVP